MMVSVCRSIAAGRARRSAEAEAAFTLEMITANFSNYSAWHRRSKLLGQAGPGHAEELDLVQNAAFTVRGSRNLIHSDHLLEFSI